MIHDNDLIRLSDLAKRVPAPSSEDFRRAVDDLAGRVVTLGLLKAILTCEKGGKAIFGIQSAAILARWLASRFSKSLPTVEKIIEARGSANNDQNSKICRSLVHDLLKINDVVIWRAIDEEAICYMANFKLYTKSVLDKEEENTSKSSD